MAGSTAREPRLGDAPLAAAPVPCHDNDRSASSLAGRHLRLRVDSLPTLLWSLQSLTRAADARIAEGAAALAHEHRAWIANEVDVFIDRVVDPSSGLVRSDRHFSAHRDTFWNASTAYANTMVALLARTVAETGWGSDALTRFFICPDSGQVVDEFRRDAHRRHTSEP